MKRPKSWRPLQCVAEKNVWLVLCCCILLNRTRREQVEPIYRNFMVWYHDPRLMVAADREELERLISPLGLVRQRVRNLLKLAEELTVVRPKNREEVLALSGCGPYAADAFSIFVLGKKSHLSGDVELEAWNRRQDRWS